MCGIAGVINYYQKRDVSKRLVQKMVSALEHRGPDDIGIYVNSNVGLGIRRLSIIDVEKGHQPISNEDSSVWIVYNGEIYNYKELRAELEKNHHIFKTNSDTEVIIHLYEEMGRNLVTRLNGMFAFALWDTKRQTLLLGRDRVGIKPLFYYIGRDKLSFGSELKALLQDNSVPRELNLQALHDYLSYLYVPAPQTIFQKIKKLPPAHTLEYVDGEVSIQAYWSLPAYEPESQDSPAGHLDSKTVKRYATEVRDRLQEAVRRRLISDVPLGAFLSGGIDSSAIVALMTQASNSQIKTFSIGFPNAGYYDERKHARKIVNQFNTKHHEFEVEPNALEILPLLIRYFDEPFADSSAIPTYYLSKMARQHVTVCLSGTGGDEIFAGYRRYLLENLIRHYQQYPEFLRNLGMSISKLLPVSRASVIKEYFLLLKRFLACQESSPMLRHISMMTCFDEDAKQQLYAKRFPHHLVEPRSRIAEFYKKTDQHDDLTRTLWADFHTYLPDDLLVKEDRMTMAASLEGRVPFLDHELVEFVASLPSTLKVHKFTTKYIFKEAMRPLLPSGIIDRRKHGFAVPIGEWFKHDLKTYATEVFQDKTTKERGYFNIDVIQALLDEHQQGLEDYSSQLWALLIFELWCREYLDKT
ncbi:asparagine synthase (glutamine-hydrolyzing) [candidate division KSB3 bacterium]|uniref:asparagine synthase (glutamine-hydrolyzing) n=1 Tax=candidate division KSB3 bacterium TaxID=2044937 RepID=A0A9D5JZK2_9BACT|nr:asparagine synthase (glutamine-hydrolyzing) [candidate division KSB3 bacterium]MBD3327113.1 asparagine synthase (glutamine-hydrolyzing) [candidate division KSB3 bacterium]